MAITASGSVALYPSDGRDPSTLLKHGDAAMYAAKRQGKHRVVCYRDVAYGGAAACGRVAGTMPHP